MSAVAPETERAVAGILTRRDLAARLGQQVAEQVGAAIGADPGELYLAAGVRAALDRLVEGTCDLVAAGVRLLRRPRPSSVGRSHPAQADVTGWSVYASVRLTSRYDHDDEDLYLVVIGNVIDLEIAA